MKYIIFIFFAVSILAADIGRITAAAGKVLIVRDTFEIPAKTGSLIDEKDTIKTLEDGKVQILFKDDTVVTMGKNSHFEISSFLFDQKVPKADFRILKGTFRTLAGKIAKIAPTKFNIKTKTATIGIRGTIILGKLSETVETFACTEGEILVSSIATGDAVTVSSGSITSVTPRQAPTAPRAYTPNEIEEIEQNFEGIEKLSIQTLVSEAKEEMEETAPEILEMAEEKAPEAAMEIKEVITDNLMEETIKLASEEKLKKVVKIVIVDFYPPPVTISLPSSPNSPDAPPVTTGSEIPIGKYIIVIPEDAEYLSWGGWGDSEFGALSDIIAADVEGAWVVGELTHPETISGYIANKQSATYQGGIIAKAWNGTDESLVSNGSANLNFNFGSETPMTGSLYFESHEGSLRWDARINSATVQTNGFNSSASDFSSGSYGNVNIQNGSLDGRFYGPAAQSVGGSFQLGDSSTFEKSSVRAAGVFEGTKQ